jgi:hypothetical protein
MIGRNDWKSAHAAVVAEARKRLGPPPTEAELDAYMHGGLPAAETERIEELLAIYPEFATAASAPFPATVPQPGDEDYLAPEELEADWISLREKLRREPGTGTGPRRILPFRRVAEAATAAAAVGFVVLFFYVQSRAGRQAAEPRINVRVAPPVVLEPGESRGNGVGDSALTLAAGADEFPLVLPLTGQTAYPDYRLELVEVRGAAERTLWSRDGLRRFENDTLAISIPRTFLAPGVYRLVVFGVQGKAPTRLATFLIRIPPRS